MHSRRDAVALAVLLVALFAIALLVRPHAAATDADDPRLSTYRSSPQGARALYLLLEELDVSARRLLELWSADRLDGVLVVLAPVEPATPRELAALRAWVEQGGTLIYGAGRDRALNRALGLTLEPLRPDTLRPLAAARWAGVTAFAVPHALTAEVDSVPGFRTAFRTSTLTAGADVLLQTVDGRATVLLYPLGAGRVMAWSDASVLGNRVLRDGGAALLFARAAGVLADDGVVHFDEYHQGYRQAGAGAALRRFLAGTAAGRAVLQAGIALLTVLLLFGHRFGAPVPDRPAWRRSPLEHVEAVAGAYRRADARRTARRLLLAGAERRLGRRLLQDGASALRGVDGSAAGRRLREVWDRGGTDDLAALAGAADDFIEEATGWKQTVR